MTAIRSPGQVLPTVTIPAVDLLLQLSLRAASDELERTKQIQKQQQRNAKVPDGTTETILDEWPREVRTLERKKKITPGDVTIELMFDPQGHERLALADDGMVDRCVDLQNRAGRPVHVVTFDVAMRTRARGAGVKVIPVELPTEG